MGKGSARKPGTFLKYMGNCSGVRIQNKAKVFLILTSGFFALLLRITSRDQKLDSLYEKRLNSNIREASYD